METQKTVNVLNDSYNENWYIINSESSGNYSHHNPIKYLISSLD